MDSWIQQNEAFGRNRVLKKKNSVSGAFPVNIRECATAPAPKDIGTEIQDDFRSDDCRFDYSCL